ncbi:putative 4-hydroxybenzoate polyprenyl transferase [Xylariomycetidae sp. FL0641]|nr:putative 4-hydroxybenzoate polyprenyl transferase [Xylariomycetidae sp. FL0641]
MNKSLHGQSDFFPHLPGYSDPTEGLVSKLPSTWIPYAQLMRIDRPAGFYAFYVPYVIGILNAACIAPDTVDNTVLLKLLALMVPLNIVLRGASCCWNDTIDQEFDRRVERCRHRPIARRAVSTSQAHFFTLSQLVVLFLMLASYPTACQLHMLIVVVLFGAYPFMKRITFFPQVFLGFPFAWALFFCIALLDVDPFGDNSLATLSLFFANILWTVTYDTIYAHQDVADDEKAGVKSMALRFRNNTKVLAAVLSTFQVALLGLCGKQAGFGFFYNLGTVCGTALALICYIYDVDLRSPSSCGFWFHAQFWLVGSTLASGFIGEYAARRSGQ